MWRYVLLASFAAVAASVAVMAVGGGVYWLWLFGDDQWPRWAENLLVGIAFAVGFGFSMVVLAVGLRKRRGQQPSPDL